jgi:hypothetical protein
MDSLLGCLRSIQANQLSEEQFAALDQAVYVLGTLHPTIKPDWRISESQERHYAAMYQIELLYRQMSRSYQDDFDHYALGLNKPDRHIRIGRDAKGMATCDPIRELWKVS